jgi:hypothetical protein
VEKRESEVVSPESKMLDRLKRRIVPVRVGYERALGDRKYKLMDEL